jgi:hypothetical protein
MGLKSAYREKKSANKPEQAPPDNKYADGGSVLHQTGQHDPGLHPKTPVVAVTPEAAQGNPSVVVGVHVGHDSTNGDEASQRLQQQLAALEQSHRIQHDPREAKLALWKQQGMSNEDEAFLRENPVLIDHDVLTGQIADEVAKHHQRGTDEHRAATKALFNQLMGDAERELLAKAAARRTHQPSPQQQPPTPRFDIDPDTGANVMPTDNDYSEPPSRRIVSAPVSREGRSGGYSGGTGKVTLTAEERAFARQIGLSDTEYATQKAKLSDRATTRGLEENEQRRR